MLTFTHNQAAETILEPSRSDSTSYPASATHTLDSSTSTIKTRFRPVLIPEPTPVSTLLGASSPRFVCLLPIGACIQLSTASFQTVRNLGTLVSQGAGSATHSTYVHFNLREVSPMNFFHHLLPQDFKGHVHAVPFDCRDKQTSPPTSTLLT